MIFFFSEIIHYYSINEFLNQHQCEQNSLTFTIFIYDDKSDYVEKPHSLLFLVLRSADHCQAAALLSFLLPLFKSCDESGLSPFKYCQALHISKWYGVVLKTSQAFLASVFNV